MTWFKIDDHFWGHPKQTALPKGAVALWVRAGSWSANLLTDGFVPTHMIAMLGATKGDARALTDAGLWEIADGGYRFHDWFEYQPTRESVEKKREEDAQRKADWRAKKAAQRAAAQARPEDVTTGQARDTGVRHTSVTASVTDVSQECPTLPVPDPTRPDPDSSKEESLVMFNAPEGATPNEKPKTSRRKPQRAIPEDFAVTDKMREWHRGRGISDYDADRQTERFIRDAQAKDKRMSNWDQAWRNWLDQAVDWGQVKAGPKLASANGDRTWTAAELDALLGPDMWRLPQPPKGMPGPEIWDWEQKTKAEHRAERVRQANEKLGRSA